MNMIWISGRLLVAGFVLLGVALSLGWHSSANSVSDSLENESRFYQETGTALPLANQAKQEKDPVAGSLDDDKLDPETLVKDWEKPDFALFVTGRQHGYMEPCGCITLERQKGGLMRRHRVQTTLQERGWDLVSIDAGNQVRRCFAQQPVIKFAKTAFGLCRVMNYDMIGLGPDDLKLPALDVAQQIDNVSVSKNPFTCANVVVIDQMFSNRFVVINRGGKRIGVTMVVGDEHREKFDKNPDEIQVIPADQGLQEVVPQMRAAKCDFNVLVAFAGLKQCRDFAKKHSLFNLVVTAGGAGDPTMEPELIESNTHVTPMIQVGVKGMYVGLVGVYQANGKTKIKYKRVPLTHKFTDTEPMKEVFLSYQKELKNLWLTGALKDITPREHPTGYSFVGSAACADCHDEEYAIWEDGVDGDGGPHIEATDSLKENPNDDRVWVQRHYDPECMSCHATGWNPQNFYPYKTGLVDVKAQEHLYGNGCENCHGPGSAHVEMEEAAAKGPVDQDQLAAMRKQMVVTLEQARSNACKECHDLDNSPDFLVEGGFDRYWPKIEHGD
ncbi:MAG: cytochrome c family protein [Planctomycetota bacterium]